MSNTKVIVDRQTQEFDTLFNVPYHLEVDHHEIHEGDSFCIYHSGTIASAAVLQMSITTPPVADPQKRVHIVGSFGGSGQTTVSMIEGVTSLAVGSGSALQARNRKRGGGDTPTSTGLFKGTTGGLITYSGGTTIYSHIIGAGQVTGGASRGQVEWVLAPATSYVFLLTSNAAGNVCWMEGNFYEHTDYVIPGV
jgi:hypothetical protein